MDRRATETTLAEAPDLLEADGEELAVEVPLEVEVPEVPEGAAAEAEEVPVFFGVEDDRVVEDLG